ncbi:cytokinesis protein sepA [Trichophyton equinum CBS 127.97]|uniref:Cytokinesis protein sepA n=1 Tax=Trichophyton equinum (strain ATCC MYA-4606 / CBS 127.97) TaxID=559882 RepID=F2Q1S1_TRIEC|nr:cytokinesis protein sepA [Trichophyton equinum CBS 127.97]
MTSDKPSKSFFGRKLHKERQPDLRAETPESFGAASSGSGSRSSRYSKRESGLSVDFTGDTEYLSGVIGSVPYDSVPVRKEPTPSKMGKPNDYHQYPQFQGGHQPANGAMHLSGPRPPPGSSGTTASYYSQSDKGVKYQAWNGHNAYPTAETSNPRTSMDQNSIYSAVSSAPRGSTHTISTDNASRYNYPTHPQDPRNQPSSSSGSRPSTSSRSDWLPQLPIVFGTLPISADGTIQRPKDDAVVDQMFYELMIKRGWQNLPEQAKRQMLAYPTSKKWTLVHQDRLTQWQGEQKRRQQNRQTGSGDGGKGLLGRADEEGSPEWYVKKVMDDSITAKELGSLSVSLRTQPISWVKSFVEAQGQIALTSVLLKINRRKASGPVPVTNSGGDKDLDREYDIAKCLKALMNNKYGADDALAHQQIIVALASSLISPRLTTRKLVSEILTFLCDWAHGQGHQKVLQAMDQVKNMQGETGRAQFTACGIKRLLAKMEGFQYEAIDRQVERYKENEGIDYEDLLQRESSSMKDSIEGEVSDMNDPIQITNAIISRLRGDRSQDFFISAMQHMLLIRENSGEDSHRMFQLVDAMLSYVAMDRRLPDMDLKQSLNFTVQSLLDKLHTDAEARRAFDESLEARQIAEAAIAERDEMKARIEMGADGLVKKLQKQIEEQEAVISLQTRQNESLKSELAEVQRIRGQELQRNELETRELKDWTGPGAATTEREQDPSELTRQDQIYLQTAFELNHYWKSRMRALNLTLSFEQEYDHISSSLREIGQVCESLRDSVSLMNVLGLILDIGNFMNDSNKQAAGFKLSSLARLGMVKDDKNESTFADLVERIVRNQYPEWEGFTDDIDGVIRVQKANVDQLQLDAKKYIDNIKNVQMSLDSGNLSDPKKFHPQDRVNLIVQRCMKDARRKAEQLQLYLDETSQTYDDIMVFYGEDHTDENSRREFFPKLATFLHEWRKSKEKNISWEENRRRTEASLARKRAKPGLTNGIDSGTPTSPTSNGAMDSLLEKLRAAAPQARDQRDRRRRARLKERHQVRLASGQHVPGITVNDGQDSESTTAAEPAATPKDDTPQNSQSKGEDIADRAASMLQGLRRTRRMRRRGPRRTTIIDFY